MAYGFQIFNAAGEVVMNDTDSLFQVRRELTLAGTAVTPYAGPTVYRYTLALANPNNLIFVKLDAGGMVGFWKQTIFYANTSSLLVREAELAMHKAKAAGSYGLEVYDAAGRCTFSTSRTLVAVKQWHDVPTRTYFKDAAFSVAQGYSWFCVPRPSISIRQVHNEYRHVLANGVWRETASSYRSGHVWFSSPSEPGPGTYTFSQPYSVIAAA